MDQPFFKLEFLISPDCADHLYDVCVAKLATLEAYPEVEPSFETCQILELVNCFEREINATAECHNDGKLNHTFVRSINFDFVNARRCPIEEDLVHLIEILVEPGTCK